MVYIGDISYVLYLVHYPVYIIMNNFESSVYGGENIIDSFIVVCLESLAESPCHNDFGKTVAFSNVISCLKL